MAETTKVVARKRDRAGKGGARSSRRDGLIPAVIYGDKQPPVMIAVEPRSVDRKSTRLNSSHSQQSRMPSSA